MGNVILKIELFFISPKFGRRILLLLKYGFLHDLKFKSFDFSFIGFFLSSDFRRYLIHKISSPFDPQFNVLPSTIYFQSKFGH